MMKSKAVTREPEYTVVRQFIGGETDTVCANVNAVDAVKELWRCSNNASAHSGIVEQVIILNGLDEINLGWALGRGYTYDGKTYYKTPVPEGEN